MLRTGARERRPLATLAGLMLPILALLAPARVAAEEPDVGVSTRGGVYQDDDETRVITAVVAVDAAAFERAKIRAHYLVDIVSTASVDVVSAATGRWDETRKEFGVAPGYDDGTRAIGAAYRRSTENDWDSHSVSLSASHDFLSHNLKLALGASFIHNDVGRADDANFSERLRVYGLSLGAVMVATRNDIFSLTYAPAFLKGYQASPYRLVYFVDPTAQVVVGASETVPEERFRHALVLEYNRHLFTDSALRSHARAYLDDWGVVSGTAGTEYVHGFGGFEPSLFVRGYLQSGARFYQDGYQSHQLYMTSDRELSPFWDVFGGFRLAYRAERLGFLEVLRAELKVAGFFFAFQDYDRLPERKGFTAELGLGGTL